MQQQQRRCGGGGGNVSVRVVMAVQQFGPKGLGSTSPMHLKQWQVLSLSFMLHKVQQAGQL
jgi:hypothetical protein